MEQTKTYRFPTDIPAHMVYHIVGSMIWNFKIKKYNLIYENPGDNSKGYYQVHLSDVDADKLSKAVTYIRFSIERLTRK